MIHVSLFYVIHYIQCQLLQTWYITCSKIYSQEHIMNHTLKMHDVKWSYIEWNMPTWTCKKEQYHFHCHLVLSNVQTTIVIEHSCYTTISFYGTSMPSIIVSTNPSINITYIYWKCMNIPWKHMFWKPNI